METIITAVGIDVSKGKSTVAVMRPGGEVVVSPFDVPHTAADIAALAASLQAIEGEVRIVMEYTGVYYLPIARSLSDAGLFVSVVHAKLVHDFGNNSIRRGKTDRKDAVKIANYALANWTSLSQFLPENVIRQQLKTLNRQYSKFNSMKIALKNSLIALLDQTFPGLNTLLSNESRATDGHEKWIDFALRFWHRDCVAGLSQTKFTEAYRKWCKKTGYRAYDNKAELIYETAKMSVAVLPKDNLTKFIIVQSAGQLNAMLDAVFALQNEMNTLAARLPEYDVVMSMYGVGKTLGPQIIAEIGDVSRFHSKHALTAFAGLDAPPYQSGQFELKERKISKRGSPHLRRTLFCVMSVIIQGRPADDDVFRFMDKKRAEGKHYYVYMTAAANKFLRVYYGKVKLHVSELAEKTKDAPDSKADVLTAFGSVVCLPT